MFHDVIAAKLGEYDLGNAVEQENALQELMQHYILASLSRAGLFAEAMFHGGTCLRIVYGINRFSQDLDFLLKKPNPHFCLAALFGKGAARLRPRGDRL